MITTLIDLSHLDRTYSSDRLSSATRPLIHVLKQLAEVIERLGDSQYTQKPVGVVQSSLGAHVRHCLDHVRALLAAFESGDLNYDDRRRGTPVEASRCCALAEVDELVAELRALPAGSLDHPISMSILFDGDGEPVEVQTSFGRELAYTLSHTIHHNALMAAMVATLGGWLPERFGYAPSTVKHLKSGN